MTHEAKQASRKRFLSPFVESSRPAAGSIDHVSCAPVWLHPARALKVSKNFFCSGGSTVTQFRLCMKRSGIAE